jgi:hypothetical protein
MWTELSVWPVVRPLTSERGLDPNPKHLAKGRRVSLVAQKHSHPEVKGETGLPSELIEARCRSFGTRPALAADVLSV